MPRTTPEQRAAFARNDRKLLASARAELRRANLGELTEFVRSAFARGPVTRAELETQLRELEAKFLDVVTRGAVVRLDVHLDVHLAVPARPPKLKGQTIEQQCAMWQRTAQQLEQRSIRLEREVRAALDGLDRDGAPAEILRRALEQRTPHLHKRRRSTRKITPKRGGR